MNKNYVALKIFNFDYSPELLSEKLDLIPTRTANKGEPYGQARGVFPWNFWELRWERKGSEIIDVLVHEYVSTVISPHRETIRQVIDFCEAEFSIAQYYFEGHNPGIHLDSIDLASISYIGAELDIDIYCLAEDE